MRLVLLVILVAFVASPRAALAHDFNPGVLALVEREPGVFDMAWTEPVDSAGAPAGVSVTFPGACARRPRTVDCGEAGLVGEISFEGMHASRMKVLVSIRFRNGVRYEQLLTGVDPRITISAADAGAPDSTSEPTRPSLQTWLRLGVEHIAGGIDHLAFVLGLLLVTGLHKRLVVTITAFTIGHSITLSLATLDLVHLNAGPVEATIAASVVLVAHEAATRREGDLASGTLTQRFPWLVALGFGLIHGLGFASALRDMGLPKDGIALPILGFNLGVELGQLALVALAFVIVRVGRPYLEGRRWPRTTLVYAIGSLGAWWMIERTVSLMAQS